jgi:hypothetical protein
MSAPKLKNLLETYQLLHVAQQDLSQSAFFADHLLNKGWHFEPWEVAWQTYLHQGAYMTAMVIAYSRPFTESRGFSKFPNKLLQLDSKEKELHKRILDLRNEIYAHADVASRKIRPIIFNGSPNAIEALPPMSMSQSDMLEIRCLISKISISVKNRILELSELVAEKRY